MIRRYGDSIVSGKYYRPRPGVYAVILRRDMLLTTYQDGEVPEVQLPGGGVDAGENPINALHRETLEETGWRICLDRRLGAFRRFTYMPEYHFWAEKICTVYLARPVIRLGAPREAGHQALWVPAQAGLDLLANAGDRAFLARALRGVAAGKSSRFFKAPV